MSSFCFSVHNSIDDIGGDLFSYMSIGKKTNSSEAYIGVQPMQAFLLVWLQGLGEKRH